MFKTPAPLLVLILILGGAWFLLQSDDPQKAAELGPTERAVDAVQPAPGQAPQLSEQKANDRAERSEVTAPLDVAEPVIVLAERLISGVELTLVNAETGEAAAGAFVRQAKSNGQTHTIWARVLLTGEPGATEQIFRDTSVYQADEHGRVFVEDFVAGSLIEASLGDLRAYLGLNVAFEGEHLMELVKPHGIDLRVEDESGRALGNQTVRFSGKLAGTDVRLKTNAQGEAALHNVNTFLGPVRGVQRALVAAVEVWADGNVTREIDLANLPDGAVVIQVPSGVHVRVQLAADGAPVENLRGRGVGLSLELANGSVLMRRTQRSPAGNFDFWGVPSGHLVTANLMLGGNMNLEREAKGVTPAAGTGRLDLVIDIPSQAKSDVTGRLVDGAGIPLTDLEFTLQIMRRSEAGSMSASNFENTDPYGDFGINLEGTDRVLGTADTLRFEFSAVVDGTVLLAPCDEISGPLSFPIALGDVALLRAPVLVAGRVVDEAGQPVTDASINVTSGATAIEAASPWAARVMPSSSPTDTEGRFEFSGLAEPGLFYSAGLLSGFTPIGERVAFEPGALDVEFVMQSMGSIMGSLDVPDGLDAVPALFGIRSVKQNASFSPQSLGGGYSTDGEWWDASVSAAGQFGWKQLAPGLYNTRLSFGNQDKPEFTWEQIEVVGGEITRDPRMQNIDVRDIVDAIEVRVVDEQGDWVEGAQFALAMGFDFGGAQGIPKSGGIVLAQIGAEGMVSAPGFLSQTVVLTTSPTQVTLQKAPAFILRLPQGIKFPDGVGVSVALRSSDKSSYPQSHRFKDGDAHVTATILGHLKLEFSVVVVMGGSSMRTSTMPSEEDTLYVDVTAGSDGAVFVLDVDQAKLDRILNQ